MTTAKKGPFREDCLFLNVYTPQSRHRGERALPVLVWIHGGGFTSGAGRDYDPTKLMADGMVVVTINYRLGALGFLSHPALASRHGESSGSYGLMDQQASLRWVKDNIERFGGDPRNVTIAGESAGGVAVLAHMVSPGSRGLFQQAIVESGSFAPTQLSLQAAETAGEAFASLAGCSDQSAACLRDLSVDTLVNDFPPFAIPGTIDGEVLTESIGTALAAGRFARVPILNGSNRDEELLFVLGLDLAVSGGVFVNVPKPVTAESYRSAIASVLGVTDARAAVIAAEYPLAGYAIPDLALSALVGDLNFACAAIQQDQWTSRAAPTFAYEFNDDTAPLRNAPIRAATHTAELPYLFDLPDAPFQDPLDADQEQLAASMRAAWVHFAASGNPSSPALRWPSFGVARVMSLVPPAPQIETDFAERHHCAFWATP
jgi:para-nitrobenzyl esterase